MPLLSAILLAAIALSAGAVLLWATYQIAPPKGFGEPVAPDTRAGSRDATRRLN